MQSPSTLRSQSQRGFSLIEVCITLFIVAAVVAMYAAAIRTTNLTQDAKYADIALRIAQTKIAQLRDLGYASLPVSGGFNDTLLASLPASTSAMTISDYNAKTKQVVVTVGWQQETQTARAISLTTLVTSVGGL